MTVYPRRFIEANLPIARISAHARREKCGGQGDGGQGTGVKGRGSRGAENGTVFAGFSTNWLYG
jgi:hypothetical protein